MSIKPSWWFSFESVSKTHWMQKVHIIITCPSRVSKRTSDIQSKGLVLCVSQAWFFCQISAYILFCQTTTKSPTWNAIEGVDGCCRASVYLLSIPTGNVAILWQKNVLLVRMKKKIPFFKKKSRPSAYQNQIGRVGSLAPERDSALKGLYSLRGEALVQNMTSNLMLVNYT